MNTNTHGPRLQGVTAKAALAYLKAEEIDHTEAPAALYNWASDNVALGDADDAEILILDWIQDVLSWARTHNQTQVAGQS